MNKWRLISGVCTAVSCGMICATANVNIFGVAIIFVCLLIVGITNFIDGTKS